MSNYILPYRYIVYKGYLSGQIELNPKDYLDYDDEEELYDVIYDEVWDYFNLGDLDIDQADIDFGLSQEFIDEWKRLKGYEV